MRKIINYICIIIQLSVFPVIAYSCYYFPIEEILTGINISNVSIELSNVTIPTDLIKAVICLFFVIAYYKYITSSNSEKLLFGGGSSYDDYPYWLYWIASNILKYKYCRLMLVPVYMQYKLLLNNTFPVFLTGNNIDETQNESNYPIEIEDAIVDEINKDKSNNTLNLILIDTYEVKENQLPKNIFHQHSIFIRRSNKIDGTRKYNQNFVDQIKAQISKLDSSIDTINIYANTNPKHNKMIVQNVFSLGQRSYIKNINVALQEKKTFRFTNLYIVE